MKKRISFLPRDVKTRPNDEAVQKKIVLSGVVNIAFIFIYFTF